MAESLGALSFMPLAAPKPCTQPGCNALVHDGSSRCMAHKVRRDSFADKRRGSRHERGYGSAWDRQRQRILRRDAGICQACLPLGFVHVGTEVDHIVPRFEGGTDDDANLQTICTAQHRAKTQAEAARARTQPHSATPRGGGPNLPALTPQDRTVNRNFSCGSFGGGGSGDRGVGEAPARPAAGTTGRPGGGA